MNWASHRRPASALVVLLAVMGLCPVAQDAAFAEDTTPPVSEGTTSTGPAIGPATSGSAVCTVTNDKLTEITGMLATAQGILVVQGGDTARPSTVVVWTLDPQTCAASSTDYAFYPNDPEDLGLAPDGALWIGDIGDGVGTTNQRVRVAFERVVLGESTAAVPYRALYPPSGKFQAEAMLLDNSGQPIVIAQQSGKGVLYRPDRPLVANTEAGLPTLVRVGEFVPVRTGTPNPLGSAGEALVTGAARSPDGSRVVIRTMSDAYEFTVGDDGDIVRAITSTAPLITPLPGEERGTAISYSPDGTQFLTLSSANRPVLRSYVPYRPAASPTASDPPGSPSSSVEGRAPSGWTSAAISQAVAVVGFLVVVTGVLGIRRARRRRHRDRDDSPDEHHDDDGRGRGADVADRKPRHAWPDDPADDNGGQSQGHADPDTLVQDPDPSAQQRPSPGQGRHRQD